MTQDAAAPLRAYVELYLDVLRETRYREISDLQPAPFATVVHGGAGTAYALWRLGRTRQASAWIDAALADRRAAAFDWEDYVGPRGAFMYGRGGLHWVRALVGGRARRGALVAFRRAARTVRGKDYMDGAAGMLSAAAILAAHVDDPLVREAGDALAASLARTLRARARKPWQPLDAVGFAHHWPGALHALLSWGRAIGEAPPPWLTRAARSLLDVWSPQTVRAANLHASWCNGLAGAVSAWLTAFAVTRDQAFLDAALGAGRGALAAPAAGVDLCCGLGGISYALLALHGVDPEAGWRDRAIAVGAHAIQHASQLKWPSGLYRGHPGLVCLAHDLLVETPRGLPAVSS